MLTFVKAWSGPLVTLLLVGAIAGCSSGNGAEGASAGNARGGGPRIVPVAAAEAQPRDLARTVTVSGPLEPIRSVEVNSQASGTVLRVLVEEGDRVAAGALMAELDARETSAQLERARAVLANAEAAYKRSQQLQASGLVTEADLDAARSSFEIAQADVELWATRLAFSRITAPVPGMVTAKQVERGSAVSPNQTMFELADDSELVVRVRVSELDVVHLKPSGTAAVRLDAYPDVRIPGKIRRIFPSADPTSRLVPVEVVLGPRPQGVEARPGFLARVEFALDKRSGAIAVPAAAVGVSEGATYVYVIDADTLIRRPVHTGVTAGGWVEVIEGLQAGERVVSSGQVNLRPGSPVRVTEVIEYGGETR